jgi:transposase
VRQTVYDLHISGVSKAATTTIITMPSSGVSRTRFAADKPTAAPCCIMKSPQSSSPVSSIYGKNELGEVSGKAKTAEATPYALIRREAQERFLKDGRIEIDSNIVERAIRPQTIAKMNSLFAGSEGGGPTLATLPRSFRRPK